MIRVIKVQVSDNFESCCDCKHSDDNEVICKLRGCIHAMSMSDIKECFKPKEKK